MSDQAAEPMGPSREGTLLYRRAKRLLGADENPQGSDQESASNDAAPRTLPAERASQEHDREGVSLLVKAVRAGHEQAKTALVELLQTGRGIGQQNLVEVLTTVQNQTTEPVVQAARGVFTALTMSSSQREGSSKSYEEMSVQELHHKLNIMVKQDKERGELQAGDQRQALETIIDKSVEFGDKNEDVVSENEFLAVAVSYANGSLPGGSLQALSESSNFKQLTWFERLHKDFLKTVQYGFQHGLHLAEARGERWLWKSIPYYQLAYIFFLYIVTHVIVPRVMWYVIPMILFYGSLVLMVIASLQQMWFQRLFKLYHVFSLVFKKSNKQLAVETYEYLFTIKHGVHSPIIFFAGYTMLIGVRPLASEFNVFSEPIVFLCLAMAGLCFVQCSGFQHKGVQLSMLLRVVSALLSLTCHFGVLDDTILGTVFCTAWPSVQILNTGVTVSIGPESALLIASLCTMLATGISHGRATWLQVVVPHFFSLAWLEVLMLVLPACSLNGFATTVTAAAALPFSPVLISIAPFYFAFSRDLLSVGIIILALLVASILFLLLLKYTSLREAEKWFYKLQTTSQILVASGAVVAVAVVIGLTHSSFNESVNPLIGAPVAPISWPYYADHCYHQNGTEAQRQLACRHFNRQLVEWNATVKEVRVSNIDNYIRSTLTGIPWGLGYYFYLIGYPSSTDCEDRQEEDRVTCLLHHRAMSGLDKLDQFKFTLEVRLVEPDADLTMVSGHHLYLNIDHIQPGTSIRFRAVISDAGRKDGPKLDATKVVVMAEDGTDSRTSQEVKEVRSIRQEMERAAGETLKGLAGLFLSVGDAPDVEEDVPQ